MYISVCMSCVLLISAVNSASVNLAINRPAIQSSNYHWDAWAYPSLANRAVDGNPNTCTYGGDIPGGPNWFAVDLGQQYNIQSVALTITDTNYTGLDYFIVGVTNELSSMNRPIRGTYPVCGQYKSVASLNVKMYQNCTPSTPAGQFVIIQQPLTGTGGLIICEMEVYGHTKLEDQFIGCFENISAVFSSQNQTSQTILGCVSMCREQQSTFAAMQNGDRCLCGDEVGNSTSVEECQLSCTGIPDQYCGGRQAYAVYTVCPIGYYGSSCTYRCHCKDDKPCDLKTGVCFNGCNEIWNGLSCNVFTPRSAITFESLGCYIDDHDRDLNGLWSFVNNSQQCFANCLDSGYLYFGTQYYTQCVCDIVYGKYGPAASSECDTLCAHTGPEICGGAGRNNMSSILCPTGTYGANCSKNCHCSDNSRCSTEGRCLSNKCAMGWKGTFCDVRNCSDHNGACGANEDCQETDLKFAIVSRCECKHGYYRQQCCSACIDVNECEDPNACSSLTAQCTNTIGGYFCTDPVVSRNTQESTENTTLIPGCADNLSTTPNCTVTTVLLSVFLGAFVAITIILVIYIIALKARIRSISTAQSASASNKSSTGKPAGEDNDVSLDEKNLYDETTDPNYESPSRGSSRDSHVYTSMNNRRTVLL